MPINRFLPINVLKLHLFLFIIFMNLPIIYQYSLKKTHDKQNNFFYCRLTKPMTSWQPFVVINILPSIINHALSCMILKNENDQIKCTLSSKKLDPKPSNCSLIRMSRHQGILLRPCFVQVLEDYHRFTDRISAMDEHWDFLVNWVRLQKQRAFCHKILGMPFSFRPHVTL